MTGAVDIETELAKIRADPQLIARYDVTGDGELDEREWELVRRMIALEIKTAEERQSNWSLDAEPQVLNDRFEVIGLLGRGGQAFTHLARDLQHGGKHVVVKELAVRVAADWKSVELFEREAQVLEHLTHPQIPRYVDAFHLEDAGSGVRFMLVQDFVDGTDLGAVVASGARWTEEEAARRMIEVCDILEYLHNKSPAVIHRDIKPSNLILGRDDKLYLVDFGAVQMVVPTTVGGSTIIGTTGYVPMEQYMGHAEPPSDLYALGASAVHMICGVHPADLPFKRNRLQIRKHLNIGDGLLELLEQMLDPDIARRPTDAGSLAAKLRRLYPERPPGSANKPERWTWRIVSTPPGATVVRSSRKLPGSTPLEVEIEYRDLPVELTVSAPEHIAQTVLIDHGKPTVVDIALERLPLTKTPTPIAPVDVSALARPIEAQLVAPVPNDGITLFSGDGATIVQCRKRSSSAGLGSAAILAASLLLAAFTGTGALAAFGVAVAIAGLVLISIDPDPNSRLELRHGGWQMHGDVHWRRLSMHDRRRPGDSVEGALTDVSRIDAHGREIEVYTSGGDIGVLRLPHALSVERTEWLVDELREALERHRDSS